MMEDEGLRPTSPTTHADVVNADLLAFIKSRTGPCRPDVVTAIARYLVDIPGKEVLVITVEYPPGGSDPVRRHDAHGFVYVLDGSVVMQVKRVEKHADTGTELSCR
jgi:quercetin dioxygenase-like cupin family protein